ncbi:EGF-like domain-containing protein [Caenorhabditis elegans]|uniref:EGF-like domain-containing protein n=1 Tax=Caenorhabditis elegans TaxID=6239 RepID=A0A077LSK8_CAEEL|nr:EGF-like domain-containing protein [Caenorhabditis elegans]CCE71513.2 EGF-like domain-containing protein [Caenorhabditis elegans]|eukprot:NP_001294218.1 Uncharacterized protein CELE_Y51H4A.24 [Caenorhabditis elegans]
MKDVVIQTVSANRHNYTKLAMVQFDTAAGLENITYFDDVLSFSSALNSNPPNSKNAASSTQTSDVLSVVSGFLAASGRPLESSMVVLLVNRWPAANADLTSSEYDTITNNNVKIFPISSANSYVQQIPIVTASAKIFTTLAANSNAHFVLGDYGKPLAQVFQYLMGTAYLDSLTITRSFADRTNAAQKQIGKLRVPHSETQSYVNFTITISVGLNGWGNFNYPNTNGIEVTFYQSQANQKTVQFEPGSLQGTNFYYATVQLKESSTYQVIYQSSLIDGSVAMVRVWTTSALYHYGSYATLEDPMGGNTLDKVDEYQGAALRMKLMNDCYTSHAGYAVFTDCTGAVSSKYDASQTIPIDYIFADEGSFPHYPIVPFFCDSKPKSTVDCVPGTESKYDIQFVAGEFIVNRSFQCRPGVGQINPNCTNVDSNGNYYCNRDQLPYMRGPTGQIPDCLGHGHVEYDFAFAEAYICVCDNSYSGDSCQIKN